MTKEELIAARAAGPSGSIQAMFNAAVLGLSKQNWSRCVEGGTCLYRSASGQRCAWGHVDPDGTTGENEAKIHALGRFAVEDLCKAGIGLAAELTVEERVFASALQSAHDFAYHDDVQVRLQELGTTYGLTWPVPQ